MQNVGLHGVTNILNILPRPVEPNIDALLGY
jgi:hypothetical protein